MLSKFQLASAMGRKRTDAVVRLGRKQIVADPQSSILMQG